MHGTGPTPLLSETIGGALDRAAERWGARDALIACHQRQRYTYAELRRHADRVARALMALGVQRGDRVGIWSANRSEWLITQYAAAKAGAIQSHRPGVKAQARKLSDGTFLIVYENVPDKDGPRTVFDLVVPQPSQPKQGALITLGVPATDADRGLRLMALLKRSLRVDW